jgi:hypothetical protein
MIKIFVSKWWRGGDPIGNEYILQKLRKSWELFSFSYFLHNLKLQNEVLCESGIASGTHLSKERIITCPLYQL